MFCWRFLENASVDGAAKASLDGVFQQPFSTEVVLGFSGPFFLGPLSSSGFFGVFYGPHPFRIGGPGREDRLAHS